MKKPAKLVPQGYWVCACVRRDKRGNMTAIKMNPPMSKRCRACGTTKLDADRIAAQVDAKP